MSQPVDVTLTNPDPSAAPATVIDLFDLIRAGLAAVVPDPFTPYVVGSTTPGVDQQNYVWFKLDGTGKPLGAFLFYGGNWRRVNNRIMGQITMFSGDPTGLFETVITDQIGRGLMGTDLDGWALCNGLNGTVNLTDKFIVGAHMDLTSGSAMYNSGGWNTHVTGADLNNGGVKDITLDGTNTYRPARGEVKVGDWGADSNNAEHAGGLYGQVVTGGVSTETLLAADAGVLTPPAIPTVPPFYALAFIQFVSYL